VPFILPGKSANALLARARIALGMSQGEFGMALGSSKRTAQRWDAGESHPSNEELHRLARMVYPKDASLALEIAVEGGHTLESLGILAPRAPETSPAAPIALIVESVVCAAAEALETKPDVARPVLRAAFARARALGLSVEQVDEALSPKAGPTRPASKATNVKRLRSVKADD
jgi:transcriptional regulator with XRE-family HTH domain